MEEFLTIKQVAERLQVSEITVRRLINRGELQSCRVGVGHRSIRIPASWFESYLDRKMELG